MRGSNSATPDDMVALVLAAREGDRASFDELVRLTYAETYANLCSMRAGNSAPYAPEAVKKMLQSARTVAYTNPAAGGTAGVYLTGLLERLGLTEEIKKKALLQTSGSATAAAVANGAAEIGITFTSELLPNKEVKVVGTMPQSIGLTVAYVAAVSSASTQAEPARALITYMTRPASRDHFKEAGL